MRRLSLIFIALALTLTACQSRGVEGKSEIELGLEQIGLQSVSEQIPGIEVYMVYATPYNFMGRVLYEGLDEAYLVPEAMEKLRNTVKDGTTEQIKADTEALQKAFYPIAEKLYAQQQGGAEGQPQDGNVYGTDADFEDKT